MPTSESTSWAAFIAAARSEHPEFAIEDDRFAAFVAARRDDATDLSALFGADLYLACGCMDGDPRALAKFDETYRPELQRGLAKLGADRLDEAVQAAMTALLVGDGERSAKLASYRGAGRLLHWIRVATARMRTDAGRAAARQPKNPRAELDVEHLLGPVELEREAFKHEYAPQIRSAFQRGLQQLDPKARTVLRQHLLDGLSQRQIAKLYGVDHKTVGRRLERARDEVWTAVREELERTLALDSAQLRSVIELVRSQLDLSLSRML